MPDISLLTACDSSSGSLKHGRNAPREWDVRTSSATKTQNPLRALLAEITQTRPTSTKPILNLGLGDPTGLHPPPSASITAIKEFVERGLDNGYIPGPGTLIARGAVAEYHRRWDGVEYAPGDVVLTHGVGHALDSIFHILIPPYSGANILLPQPGFAQYAMLLGALGCDVRYYHLDEGKGWEVDLHEMEGLMDENTRAVVVTNPSNPCGSNYSERHLREIINLADQYKVPIIADEIYGHMTWSAPFHPLASLSTTVPIITLNGLSKRFLLPGWRIGWIALHDPLSVAGEVRDGMVAWSNRFMGPSSVVQAALPAILETPKEWFWEVMDLVRINAEIVERRVKEIPHISCTTPQGSLYILVKLPQHTDDLQFCKDLYRDQGVFVMPGSMFDAPGYIRLVIASPETVMTQVMDRLEGFCAGYLADRLDL